MKQQDRYLKNLTTARRIIKRLGFVLSACDTDWRVYDKFNTINESITIPDRVMGRFAYIFGYEWHDIKKDLKETNEVLKNVEDNLEVWNKMKGSEKQPQVGKYLKEHIKKTKEWIKVINNERKIKEKLKQFKERQKEETK